EVGVRTMQDDHQEQRGNAAAFFRSLADFFDARDLEAENQRLRQELLKLEELWRQERRARREADMRSKLLLVEMMADMPPEFWEVASRIARSWREFRGS